jgi:hypothetical protein
MSATELHYGVTTCLVRTGRVTRASRNPEKAFAAVAKALELPPDTDPDTLRRAFDELLSELNAGTPDPSGPNADAPPPAVAAAGATAVARWQGLGARRQVKPRKRAR